MLAVRSSAVDEDGAEAAFAGAGDTHLYVKPEELLPHVKEIWASLWNPRALLYRETKGLSTTNLAQAVVVQAMADSEVSGVAFTQDPVSGDSSRLVVNAAFGLGEGVVSGRVAPDQFVVGKALGREVLPAMVSDKKLAIVRGKDGVGTEEHKMPPEWRRRRSMSPAKLEKLNAVALALESHFGYALDIEFGFVGDKLFILQARPVTNAAAEEVSPPAAVAAKAVPVKAASTTETAVEAKRMLFVCAGNTCRSPMAERLAKQKLREEGRSDFEVLSRGLDVAEAGAPMSAGARAAVRNHGADGEGHAALSLERSDVIWADVILTMTSAQAGGAAPLPVDARQGVHASASTPASAATSPTPSTATWPATASPPRRSRPASTPRSTARSVPRARPFPRAELSPGESIDCVRTRRSPRTLTEADLFDRAPKRFPDDLARAKSVNSFLFLRGARAAQRRGRGLDAREQRGGIGAAGLGAEARVVERMSEHLLQRGQGGDGLAAGERLGGRGQHLGVGVRGEREQDRVGLGAEGVGELHEHEHGRGLGGLGAQEVAHDGEGFGRERGDEVFLPRRQRGDRRGARGRARGEVVRQNEKPAYGRLAARLGQAVQSAADVGEIGLRRARAEQARGALERRGSGQPRSRERDQRLVEDGARQVLLGDGAAQRLAHRLGRHVEARPSLRRGHARVGILINVQQDMGKRLEGRGVVELAEEERGEEAGLGRALAVVGGRAERRRGAFQPYGARVLYWARASRSSPAIARASCPASRATSASTLAIARETARAGAIIRPRRSRLLRRRSSATAGGGRRARRRWPRAPS